MRNHQAHSTDRRAPKSAALNRRKPQTIKGFQFQNPGKHTRMRRRDRANSMRPTHSPLTRDSLTFQFFRGIEMKMKLALSALAAALVLGACGGKEAAEEAADAAGQAAEATAEAVGEAAEATTEAAGEAAEATAEAAGEAAEAAGAAAEAAAEAAAPAEPAPAP
jgi:hypothetical protein